METLLIVMGVLLSPFILGIPMMLAIERVSVWWHSRNCYRNRITRMTHDVRWTVGDMPNRSVAGLPE